MRLSLDNAVAPPVIGELRAQAIARQAQRPVVGTDRTLDHLVAHVTKRAA